MQYKIVFCLLVLSMLLGGCIRENNDPCEKRLNNSFRWRYGNEIDPDVLKQEIRQATVFLFSNDDYFIKSWQIDNSNLFAAEGRILDLAPGRYTMVVWSNALDRTSIMPVRPGMNTSVSDFNILLKEKAGEVGFPTSDSLFHGKVVFDIAEHESREYIVPLRRECCYFKIYMEDFPREPLIKIQGMPGGYDFEGELLPINAVHIPTIKKPAIHYETSLATLRPSLSNPFYLELYEKEGVIPFYTLDLRRAFEELNIDPRRDDEVNIVIRLKALEGNKLSIVVNDWYTIENILINM